jgi:hypothetical protein
LKLLAVGSRLFFHEGSAARGGEDAGLCSGSVERSIYWNGWGTDDG